MEDQREGPGTLERAAKLIADGEVLLLFTGATNGREAMCIREVFPWDH